MSWLVAHRTSAQQLVGSRFTNALDLVRSFGAVQAQDFAASRWALAVRLPDGAVTDASLEDEIGRGVVVRMHVLRWTWQLVAPDDARPLVALVRDRLYGKYKTRHAQLQLDAKTFQRSRALWQKALAKGPRTRDELGEVLQRDGIPLSGERLSHLLGHAELAELLCSGPRHGKQPTYRLLDDVAKVAAKAVPAEEVLVDLARRYFATRGPASAADFAWWTGLTLTQARRAMAELDLSSRDDLHWLGEPPRRVASSGVMLLPGFDEYLVAYQDRDAVLDPKEAKRINAGGGVLNPVVVDNGHVVGVWRRDITPRTVSLDIDYFEKPGAALQRGVAAAAERYAAFHQRTAEVSATVRGR